MLFALFFGAGNLIYPPTLGIDSGTSYIAAISGFVITGVGLPILAVSAISFVKDDPRELANRVHPWFGLRSVEHTSELQSRFDLVCRLLLEKKNSEYGVIQIDSS